MTGEGTEETPAPAEDRPTPPKRRRRRRRRGGKRPQGTGGAAATAGSAGTPQPTPDAVTPPDASGAKKAGTRRRRPPPKKGKQTRTPTPANAKLPWTREVSAGGVVYRRTDAGAIEVVLASRRTRRGDLAWGLAKGGIEDGESREAAAIREVREETGLTAEIEGDLGDTKYMYVWEDVKIRKTVHFFLMRCTGGDVDDRDDEMEEIRWFPLERALKRAAYRGERDVLKRAADRLT
jgi:8-oxo-dGTP pyrophosphatase MutT (NUDIX family)